MAMLVVYPVPYDKWSFILQMPVGILYDWIQQDMGANRTSTFTHCMEESWLLTDPQIVYNDCLWEKFNRRAYEENNYDWI